MASKPFYITTPIYYVNDKPHLGHAYTTIAADVKARFHRLRGEEVRFLTGTDEHGQKLARAAEEAGMAPKPFTDLNCAKFRGLWEKLNISYDDFIRTTEDRHKKGVAELWRRVFAAGDIYKGEYEGKYCVSCETYFTDLQLLDGNCPDCGRPAELVSEDSYFFRLGKYEKPLLDHYERHPGFIMPESRRNEIISFVRGGLRDLSVSRTSLKWGISVPDDPSHVIYVWFDALSNYMTAAGFGPGGGEGGFAEATAWPADQHFIGKDILRFHAVYWPAFLLSAGIPLPEQVYSHGWWTIEGQKMSKSLGNAVDPHWLIEEYGVDAIRYFVLREIPFGLDGDFSHSHLISRINSDLANDLGNLLHRTLNMVKRYRKGRLLRAPGGEGQAEKDLCSLVESAAKTYEREMEATNFQEGLKAAWTVVSAANKYIDSSAPWELAKKKESDRLDAVLYHAGASLRVVAALVLPFMPEAAGKICAQLGLPAESLSAPFRELTALRAFPESVETRLGKPIFPRIEEEARAEIEKKVAARIAAGDAADAPAAEPGGEGVLRNGREGVPQITFDEFQRLDLRVVKVVAAAPVPKSKNLIKLEVELSGERRTVVAGIAKHYAPDQLVGRRLVLVANLEPTTLMGVESQGMILAAVDGDRIRVLGVDGEVEPGARVR